MNHSGPSGPALTEEEAARLASERLRRLRYYFGPMLDNQMIDLEFDETTYDDIVRERPIWYDDTTLSSSATRYKGSRK